jgi:hypothetical protein
MRTISQTDLNRHKKRKGITVKRKLGSAPEKPESEVNGSQSLSGETAQAEAIPAPASEFYSLMGKMTEIMERLAPHETDEPKEVAEIEAKPEQKKRPFELLKELQDADELPPPTVAVELKAEEPEVSKPSGNWDHVLRRDGTGLVMQIVSIDKKGTQWTHDFTRAGTKFIIEILSKSNTGLRLMHKFQRNERSALIESATTRVEA